MKGGIVGSVQVRFRGKQVEDATRPIGLGPQVSEEERIILADDSLIGRHDHSRRRIVGMRQLVKRNVARPFAVVSRAVVGNTPVATLADGNPARAIVTDVSVNVGVNKVLSWSDVLTKCRGKLFPVACSIHPREAGHLDRCGIECSPAQRISDCVLFENDGAVARYGYIMVLDFGYRTDERLANL